LSGHTVSTAQLKGWDTLSNGALLDAAEAAGFELLLTTDRRIRHQQNLQVPRVALVVLTGTTRWSRVRQHAERIAAAVASATPGSYPEVSDSLGRLIQMNVFGRLFLRGRVPTDAARDHRM
jgi:hypothetical protein